MDPTWRLRRNAGLNAATALRYSGLARVPGLTLHDVFALISVFHPTEGRCVESTSRLMNVRLFLAVMASVFAAVSSPAQIIVVEPDNFTNRTVLNHVEPAVSLITADANNLPHPPVPFDVWASTVPSSPFLPPTGLNVFSHVGVAFWNNNRRLRMDFAGLVSMVSIDFQNPVPNAFEQGTLAVYGADNTLLDSYTTASLAGGLFETMLVNRPTPDIAYAVAYTITPDSPFGRLDHLQFSMPVAVPEPGVWCLAGVGLLAICWRRAATRS
jgi:PEP-CTERM motif